MAQTFGSSFWLKHLAEAFGSSTWLKHLAQAFGSSLWLKHLAQILTQSFGSNMCLDSERLIFPHICAQLQIPTDIAQLLCGSISNTTSCSAAGSQAQPQTAALRQFVSHNQLLSRSFAPPQMLTLRCWWCFGGGVFFGGVFLGVFLWCFYFLDGTGNYPTPNVGNNPPPKMKDQSKK